jgi:hypothetical protein
MTGRGLAHPMVHGFLERIATDPKERARLARALKPCPETIPGKSRATARGVAQNRVGSATTETQKRQGGESLALPLRQSCSEACGGLRHCFDVREKGTDDR